MRSYFVKHVPVRGVFDRLMLAIPPTDLRQLGTNQTKVITVDADDWNSGLYGRNHEIIFVEALLADGKSHEVRF